MGTTILGMGRYYPQNKTEFSSGTRYRIAENGETQLQMGVKAAQDALYASKTAISEIDLIISACAVIIQPIPCNAALLHAELGASAKTAALDVCTTCTSFISAFDMADCYIKAGRYKKILIISSDLPSIALNPEETESFSLFSDGAAAAVVGEGKGEIIKSIQYTFSSGAHLTEIACGGTAAPAFEYNEHDINDYRFTMEGIAVVRAVLKNLPDISREFLVSANTDIDGIDMVIPHQASHALELIMKKCKIKKEKYLDIFKEYGNMVSASVPFSLSYALDNGIVKKGDNVLLVGTAAGLHINLLLLTL